MKTFRLLVNIPVTIDGLMGRTKIIKKGSLVFEQVNSYSPSLSLEDKWPNHYFSKDDVETTPDMFEEVKEEEKKSDAKND